MLCTAAINTSNTTRTQTGAAERQSSGLDSNSRSRGPRDPGKIFVKINLTDLQILGCELHRNVFGGRVPPRPAGGAERKGDRG